MNQNNRSNLNRLQGIQTLSQINLKASMESNNQKDESATNAGQKARQHSRQFFD